MSEGPKALPHDIDSEMGVLGAMLLNGEVVPLAESVLEADDFYRVSHGVLFDAIRAVYQEAGKCDEVMVRNHLRRIGKLEDVTATMVECMERVPSSANAEHYIDTVRQDAYARRQIGNLQSALADLQGGSQPHEVVASCVEALEAAERAGGDARAAADLIEELEQQMERKARGEVVGLTTPWHGLNRILGPIETGGLVLLAGKQKSGKTCAACQLVNHWLDAGVGCYIASFEMSDLSVMERLMVNRSGASARGVRQGKINRRSEWVKARQELAAHSGTGLFIEDRVPGPDALVSRMRQHARQHDIGVAVVDFVQLVGRMGAGEYLYRALGDLAMRMVTVAKEEGLVVLALSQVTVNKQTGHTSMRESQDLEQACTLALYLMQPSDNGGLEGPKEESPDEVSCIEPRRLRVALSRFSPTGVVNMEFDGDKLRLYEPDSAPTRKRAPVEIKNADGSSELTDEVPF